MLENNNDYTRYPLELHMVHRNIHDDTIQEALRHENGLAVLGFKFKIEDDKYVIYQGHSLILTFSDMAQTQRVERLID